MIKFSIRLLTLVFSLPCFSQVSAVVVEAETRKQVPYVNIGSMGQPNGTSSNANGYFEIDVSSGDSLVFSAVGYKTKRVAENSLSDTLFLEKQVTRLREVVVRSENSSEEITLGEYKANRIRYYTGTSNINALVARYFAFPANEFDVLFLDQLSIYTKSEIDGAKFAVRLYGVASDGSPGEYLHGENIYAYARKGWKRTEVDLSNLTIAFPENGLFIAVESLRIMENEYTVFIDDPLDKSKKPKKIEMCFHAPVFGHIPKGGNEWGWQFFQGKWKHRKQEGQEESRTTGAPVAVALRVTN